MGKHGHCRLLKDLVAHHLGNRSRNIGVAPRLALQIGAVAAVLAALPADLRIVAAMPWWLERAVLLFGCLWLVNLTNFMDGIDGMEDNAGACVTPDTLARAAAQGLALDQHLLRNDAYGFFAALNDLVVTGPTHTNVNDFRAILIL